MNSRWQWLVAFSWNHDEEASPPLPVEHRAAGISSHPPADISGAEVL